MRKRLSIRIYALFMAYTLALQAVVAGFALSAHATGGQPFELSYICSAASSAPTQDGPAGADRIRCAMHCLLMCCGHGNATGPAYLTVAFYAPAEIRGDRLIPLELHARIISGLPHIARAPPPA